MEKKCKNCKYFCIIRGEFNACTDRNTYIRENYCCDNYKPKNEIVQGNTTIIRNTLLSNKDCYNAFVASIESALRDMLLEIQTDEAARLIADRIIGVEK